MEQAREGLELQQAQITLAAAEERGAGLAREVEGLRATLRTAEAQRDRRGRARSA